MIIGSLQRRWARARDNKLSKNHVWILTELTHPLQKPTYQSICKYWRYTYKQDIDINEKPMCILCQRIIDKDNLYPKLVASALK